VPESEREEKGEGGGSKLLTFALFVGYSGEDSEKYLPQKDLERTAGRASPESKNLVSGVLPSSPSKAIQKEDRVAIDE